MIKQVTVPGGSGKLLFQNGACMVVNKACGESSEFPNSAPDKTEDNVPPGHTHSGAYLSPVHRLDVPVSGCLLLAKTREAAAFLSAAFAEGRVKKQYLAIIENPDAPLPEYGELTHWLQFDRSCNKSIAHTQPAPGRKKAVLHYRVAGKGERYLFLEIDLVTGRHHQIRAQLEALRLHIKGDLKYGAKRSEKSGGIRLHSYLLAFPNPLNAGEVIEVKAMPVMDSLWAAFFG